MDGEIGVQTGPGRGSTFWIDLPRTAPAEAADMEMTSFKRSEESSDSAPIGGEHAVLYIEDNPANVRLMRKIIARRPECSLIDAPTGELGLEMAAAHRPDIIIIDINLPGIDGFEVFRRLQIADEGRDTPVIALSAGAIAHDILRGREAGFLEYLTKPLEVRLLLRALDRALARGQEAAE